MLPSKRFCVCGVCGMLCYVLALPQKQNHSSELEAYLAEIQYLKYKQKISVEIIISLVALNVKLFKIN